MQPEWQCGLNGETSRTAIKSSLVRSPFVKLAKTKTKIRYLRLVGPRLKIFMKYQGTIKS